MPLGVFIYTSAYVFVKEFLILFPPLKHIKSKKKNENQEKEKPVMFQETIKWPPVQPAIRKSFLPQTVFSPKEEGT